MSTKKVNIYTDVVTITWTLEELDLMHDLVFKVGVLDKKLADDIAGLTIRAPLPKK